jgi:hypothetical protein
MYAASLTKVACGNQVENQVGGSGCMRLSSLKLLISIKLLIKLEIGGAVHLITEVAWKNQVRDEVYVIIKNQLRSTNRHLILNLIEISNFSEKMKT